MLECTVCQENSLSNCARIELEQDCNIISPIQTFQSACQNTIGHDSLHVQHEYNVHEHVACVYTVPGSKQMRTSPKINAKVYSQYMIGPCMNQVLIHILELSTVRQVLDETISENKT